LATVETISYRVDARRSHAISPLSGFVNTGALTLIAILVQGYHPYAEDGGLYLAGVKRLLYPSLYPTWTEFVTAQTGYSLFAPAVAALVRFLHLNLMTGILLIYVASIWGTLLAAWMLAARCFEGIEASIGSVLLLAVWLAMPVAGTSLMMMDPYVTARSISTPLGLLAFSGAVDVHRSLECGFAIAPWKIGVYLGSALIAELAHPLMATYALSRAALFLTVSLPDRKRRLATIYGLMLFALAAAACIFFLAPSQTPEYIRAAQTRAYWFIDSWQSYELFGLVAPLVVIAAIAARTRNLENDTVRSMAYTVALAGAAGVMIALIFARTASASYAVARLQPLRIFQFIYLLMILLLGGFLCVAILKRRLWAWATLLVLSGGGMFLLQLQTYPHSAHLELPWDSPRNGWHQGFLWIRQNAPSDALFALDAKYISANGEDSQNFRAIAERSALPDYSKDGGLASITPKLARQWSYGENIQTDLDIESDSTRAAKLARTSASWLVLSSDAHTELNCPYANQSMKVCRIAESPNPARVSGR